jgi:hypothetical protein
VKENWVYLLWTDLTLNDEDKPSCWILIQAIKLQYGFYKRENKLKRYPVSN